MKVKAIKGKLSVYMNDLRDSCTQLKSFVIGVSVLEKKLNGFKKSLNYGSKVNNFKRILNGKKLKCLLNIFPFINPSFSV